ncbi:DUF2946 family protein [Roseateles chitosanitabidus]|uniref:DUF2946 family protein n=1 Tax=Roseateles chitosanitabidus TaxID=65048 RepID=UPI00082A6AD0|nr:DUF2946 family protein [Roseateles chitosanitabidus]
MRLAARTSLARWMVLVTFWLASLMPAVSMAARALDQDIVPWAPVCGASFNPLGASVDAATAPDDRPAGGALDQEHSLLQHCPFCHLHQDALPLPPAPGVPPLRTELRHGLPERFFSASVTAHAWRAAPARAPPLTA